VFCLLERHFIGAYLCAFLALIPNSCIEIGVANIRVYLLIDVNIFSVVVRRLYVDSITIFCDCRARVFGTIFFAIVWRLFITSC
jgi:hypothetical protein